MRKKLNPRFGLALAALLLGVGAASAQGRSVDESALRFYASSGQAERAQAELRRLRALYPDWTPPDNIFEKTAAGGADEEDLWDLYAANRLQELQDAILARRAAEPGWEPSADLRGKVRVKLFRARVLGMARDGHYADIVRDLKTNGLRLDGVDVETLWAVADAWRATRQNSQALDIYKTILRDNSEAGPRLATVQKAIGALRMDEAEQLIAMGKKDASGKSEFEPIALDIARARIAAFLHDERKDEVEAGDLKIFADYAKSDKASKDPNQPALLGWYHYKLKAYAPALDWFKYSLEHGGDAMVAHGLAHSLRYLGMKREAEEVAYAWREPLVNNSILFIDILERDLTRPIPPYIEPERLSRYGEVTMQTASGEGAQALAWYAYNSCQYDVALQWFERAVAWHPKEPTVYGLALTLNRVNSEKPAQKPWQKSRQRSPREDAAMQWINRYDGLFPLVVEILFPVTLKPPTPCDQPRLANGAPYYGNRQAPPQAAYSYGAPPQAAYNYGAQPQAAYINGAPAQAGSMNVGAAPGPYVVDPAGQYAWGRVTPPGGGSMGQPMPKVARGEFPVAVTVENPLRFAPAGQGVLLGPDGAPSGGFAQDRFQGLSPLVARRVPGVGAMPYERYGYALLPGYNGVLTYSSPRASDQAAPAGTLWSKEPPDDATPDSNQPATARDSDPRQAPNSSRGLDPRANSPRNG
jgi:tetratricopeptide (TPR) repeat protein